MMKKPLIILTGPTASGKTELSVALAKQIGGEIISADSMQVYRHMDIGSAKVTKEEMDGIPHHLLDVLEPWEDFNVALVSEAGKRGHGKDLRKRSYPHCRRRHRFLYPGSAL